MTVSARVYEALRGVCWFGFLYNWFVRHTDFADDLGGVLFCGSVVTLVHFSTPDFLL